MNFHNVVKKTNDIIISSPNCYVGIITTDGIPHVSTRSFCKEGNILTSYISTDTSGNLAKSIKKCNKMSLCVNQGNDNVTLMGTAEIIDDMAIKKELWLDWFINHYKQGPSDPEYTIIKFITQKVSLWVDREIIKCDLEAITKVQSCCGLLCDTCDFVTSNGCKKCIATKGNPFYGECVIAKCALEKSYNHCGECAQMPCEKLKEYSCGDGEHCDKPKGSRLVVLNIWNEARSSSKKTLSRLG